MNAQMLKRTAPAPRFLVICLVSIAALVTVAAGPANPDRRALKQLLLGGATRTPLVFAQSRRVHGPFVPDPRRFTIAAPSSTEGDELVESTIRQGCTTASCAELLPADGDLDALSPALTSGPWTPGRIDGIDPQIAASDAYLTVATNNTIGFYDKAGALLRRRPNRVVGNQILVDPELENPVSARDFFKVFWADPSTSINQWLNLPDGLCDPANPYPADKNFCLDAYYDVRAVYDEYRQRFWVGALVKNTANKAFVGEDHLRATSRRDAFVFAVSRTQDPRDGWFFYWIAAVGDAWRCRYPDNPETAPDRCGGYWPGDGSDYEHIGVSERFFVMSVPVKNGSNPDIGFMGTAEDPDPADRRYTALFVLDAHALANGQAAPHWVFGIRRENSDGHNIQSPIAPAIHHGSSPFELTWLSSTFGSDHLTVFALLPYQPLLLNFDLPVRPFSSPRTAPQPSDPAIPTPRRINLGTNVDFAVQKTIAAAVKTV
jgi:hypothetical protein